jgi:hypothetical protein
MLIVTIGVVKKLLDALKGEYFTAESLKLFMTAFRSLLVCCMSAELLRSLALFITYAIHKPKLPSSLQKKKSLRFDNRSRRATQPQPIETAGTYLSKPQIGIEVLKMYSGLLCTNDDVTTVRKFARTVTNKVSVTSTHTSRSAEVNLHT